ncbi:hypothetical protein CLAIMM_13137 isoform 2 [Cladophialophora immunda]|nr:hypothetical protein CLAIMM_13137 isoform 2 [Cladophialophora immunda]
MSSSNPTRPMNPMKWFLCCFDDNDEDEQPQQTPQTRQAPRTRWDAAPPVDPELEEPPPPPPYALFDPHPEDCECAIHIHKPRPNRPIVVEAFQSQGCNSCPPTNTLLLSLLTLADPNILVLDYHVTYWDHLGWTDPLGIPEADAHQREYAQASGTSRVYTPQVVVNGVSEGVGNSTRKLEKLIKEGGRLASEDWPWLLFSKVDEGILIREASAAAAATGRRGRVIESVEDDALEPSVQGGVQQIDDDGTGVGLVMDVDVRARDSQIKVPRREPGRLGNICPREPGADKCCRDHETPPPRSKALIVQDPGHEVRHGHLDESVQQAVQCPGSKIEDVRIHGRLEGEQHLRGEHAGNQQQDAPILEGVQCELDRLSRGHLLEPRDRGPIAPPQFRRGQDERRKAQ